tara:strand:+ start:64 stop:1221 length:1158 start_codon:yes stop_codon:yes gene_type:complete
VKTRNSEESGAKARDELLDAIRGLSALMVLAAHIRGFVFLDFGELTHPGPVAKAFYFGTGIHHQAVMVFFVLSGYFVGGGVLRSIQADRFAWKRYALARICRLWMALIPALVLTLVCDWVGGTLAPEAYGGGWHAQWFSGPTESSPARHDAITLLGNLAFLQTISVPVFGSNGPLWSLANEFWYYLTFPLLAVGAWNLAKSPKRRIFGLVSLLTGVSVLCWLPLPLVSKGAVWLLGVVVWLLATFADQLPARSRHLWRITGACAFVATLVLSKTDSPLGSDFAVGLAFAIWMMVLLGPWIRCSFLRPVSRFFSEISYTLYVTHFPILFLFAATQLKGSQLEFGPKGVGLFLLLFLGCILIATLLWWLFERRTNDVRKQISRLLGH